MPAIDSVLTLPQRKLVVSENDVSLDTDAKNKIFILIVEEAAGAAGGRAAGSGSRRIIRIHGFKCKDNKCDEFFQTSDQQVIDRFDIPYSAVAMDIKLSDGRPYVVQGVVDPELAKSYMAIISSSDKTE